jgi:prostaglandin-endoperoxide synthase 2
VAIKRTGWQRMKTALGDEFVNILINSQWVASALGALPPVATFVNKLLVNGAIGRIPSRPLPYSTMSDYTSWASLTDRTFCGRHLPSAVVPADLPGEDEVAETLFLRPASAMRPSLKSTVMFAHFAAWFTDSFLRIDPRDHRKNTSNHDLDLCNLYGLNSLQTDELRSKKGGKLKSQFINGAEFPPHLYDENFRLKEEFKNNQLCKPGTIEAFKRAKTLGIAKMYNLDLPVDMSAPLDPDLFAVGTERVNFQTGYLVFNTLCLREHNRICDVLQKAFGGWDDERLFQTARNILIIVLVRIVIEEYINHISPLRFKYRFAGGAFEKQAWYRENWMSVEFDLLYRWHSMVPDAYYYGTNGAAGGSRMVPTTETYFNNKLLIERGVGGVLDDASRQKAGEICLFNTTSSLLPIETFGIRAARFYKLPPYNAYRDLSQAPLVTSFEQINPDPQVQARLRDLYKTVDRVEYYPGLFAEPVTKNAALPTMIGRLVAADAFSMAMTNPLLAARIWEDEGTFTKVGMDIIQETKSLHDIVKRNARTGSDSFYINMDIAPAEMRA